MKSIEQIKNQQSSQLLKLIKWIGSKAKLGRECNASKQTVNGWCKRGRISRDAATIVHIKSDGLFKREDLRPDIKWIDDL